jgi:hypothetical protein
MHVLRGVLSMSGVGNCVEATVGYVQPASLRLVSQEKVGAVLPSKPSVHLLGEVPDLIIGLLMQPVVEWAVELVRTVSRNLLGEFSLKAGEYIVELESVG